MIDIHCHMLFGVDDGSDTLEESRKMLHRAHEQGITRIVLTPHYRHGMFLYRTEDILRNFSVLRLYAREEDIRLYLGCEYHVDSDIFEHLSSGRCFTMAGGRYVLTEYSHVTAYPYIVRMTRALIAHGYRPIIAHAERYPAVTDAPERAAELRGMGAMIQVNADAVLGHDGRRAKKFCRTLFLSGDIDIVASDSHGMSYRPCRMDACRDLIVRKYGAETARLVLSRNPGRVIRDS